VWTSKGYTVCGVQEVSSRKACVATQSSTVALQHCLHQPLLSSHSLYITANVKSVGRSLRPCLCGVNFRLCRLPLPKGMWQLAADQACPQAQARAMPRAAQWVLFRLLMRISVRINFTIQTYIRL
jgi:hypothetical protein